MNRRTFLAAGASAAFAANRPNIVLILADDLGYGDLGCFGGRQIRTAHLDRLAAQGSRLTAHYVCSPVCSASRAGLLTGRYPERTGVTGVLREEHDQSGLSLSETTLAQQLSRAGYETALVGKWHLGMPEAYRPTRRGFQSFYGFLNGTIDYDTHLSTGGGWRGRPTTFRDETPIREGGYYPDLLTKEAVRFVRRKHDRPFFLFLSLPLPHTPLQVPAHWSKPYEGGKGNAIYAGMVACMDDGVGQVLRALDEQGLRENTAVVFFSDNGSTKNNPRSMLIGSNEPFGGGKYELREGGLRSPCIVRWPGVTRPGSVIDTPLSSLDWFPTLAAPNAAVDGENIQPVLRGGRPRRERSFFWAFRDDLVKTPQSYACRRGHWKYMDVAGKEMLYDLRNDPGETKDLAARRPEVTKSLSAELRAWRSSVGG